MDELERNNYAELCGTLAAPPALSHENRQERFFTFPLETQRLSGTCLLYTSDAADEL